MSIILTLTNATVSQDPEIKHFESGSSVLKIKLRANNGEKKAEGDQYAPSEWFTVEVWGKLGVALEKIIHKHTADNPCRLSLMGNFVSRKWKTETSEGVEYLIKNPSNIELLDRKYTNNAEDEEEVPASVVAKKATYTPVEEDTVPF